MNKRLSSIFVIGLTTSLLFSSSGYAANSNDISVVVNGKSIVFTAAKPFKDANGRLQLPLRSIGEALGAEVTWNESTQTATFKISDTVSSFTVGQKKYKVNGTSVTMDTTVVKKNNSVYAPARYVAESLGASIQWDNPSGVLTVINDGSIGKKDIATGAKESTTNNPFNEPNMATVHGFKIPYTEMGPNSDPAYVSASKLVVYETVNPEPNQNIMQFSISFTKVGTDPVQAMNEAEAILRQQIESNVVDSIMSYVRTKKQRNDALPLKWFEAKDYKVFVNSQAMGEIGIGLVKK